MFVGERDDEVVVMRTVGQKIKELREQERISQEELGRRAGVSTASISKIEQGKVRQPSRITLLGIADALSVSPDELLVQEEPAAVGKAGAPQSGQPSKEDLLDLDRITHRNLRATAWRKYKEWAEHPPEDLERFLRKVDNLEEQVESFLEKSSTEDDFAMMVERDVIHALLDRLREAAREGDRERVIKELVAGGERLTA